MKPYYEDESVVLYHGDCRDVRCPVTAADHANTVREAVEVWVRDVETRNDALAALDALEAQAKAAQFASGVPGAETIIVRETRWNELKAAEAERDRLREERNKVAEQGRIAAKRYSEEVEERIVLAARVAELEAALRAIADGASPTRKTTADRAPHWTQATARAALARQREQHKDST